MTTTTQIKAKKGDVLEVNVIGSTWRFSRRLVTREDIKMATGVVNDPGTCGWRLVRDGVVVG